MSSSPGATQRTFLGHPLGLYVLFFTEMWERFSYYGMRALLVLYMLDHFKWSQRDASTVYKWYTSLVYLTPLLGGYLADRYLGNKRAVIIGAVLMAVGQFMLTFEQREFFFAALAFLIFGNGFFKPNMSTQVGRLYPQNDPRRDGAYTIFYMGINLGAFLSPLVCGWLAMNTVGGRHTGFLAAGIGMLLGLAVYLLGLRWVIELKSGEDSPVSAGGDERLPPDFVRALRELQAQTQTGAGAAIHARVPVVDAPPGFDVRPAGLREDELRYDPNTKTLIATTRLTEQQIQTILNSVDSESGPAPVQITRTAISEQNAEQTPSSVPLLNRLSPGLFRLIGYGLLLGTVALGAIRGAIALLAARRLAVPQFLQSMSLSEYVANNTLISLAIVAICALIAGWILGQSQRAMRDRVLTIYVLGIFVVFFWAAFEQAGNALNVWADKSTNRYLTRPAKAPPLFPDKPPATAAPQAGSVGDGDTAGADASSSSWSRWLTMWQLKPSKAGDAGKKSGLWAWFVDLWNPVATEWFQSINALAIFLLAPLFAWMWTALDRRGLNPSVPAKMAIGVLLMSLSFGLMIVAAEREDRVTDVAFNGHLPSQIKLGPGGELCGEEDHEVKAYQAGRLSYDATAHRLHMRGVLGDTERDRIVRDTAPESFVKAVKELQEKSVEAAKNHGTARVALDPVPPGLDPRYAGFDENKVRYDEATHTLLASDFELKDKDVKALLVAAGEPAFRDAVNTLYQESARHRVSPWWLFWFYIIATLAELCLSPVGLSMVSKLAPAKFATMLMGLWLLTSFFGNFAAGAFGERWGEWTPTEYFLYIMALLGAATVVLFVLVRKIGTMMHGVR
jgi:dipeptide/tripeptide permease